MSRIFRYMQDLLKKIMGCFKKKHALQSTIPQQLPRHVAIIMDGNTRWAKQHGQPAIFGHSKGADAAYNVVSAARQMGIQYLTLYAFSSENWNRPTEEVAQLMGLLRSYLENQVNKLLENEIKLRVIGDRTRLATDVQQMIHEAEVKTAACDKMTLVLAISYGGREEILRACKRVCEQVTQGQLKVQQLDEDLFSDQLDTAGLPDPDFLIRTSGEYRTSNFLCWQLSYTELYFTKALWPDFTKEAFIHALADYGKRERRFGQVSPYVA